MKWCARDRRSWNKGGGARDGARTRRGRRAKKWCVRDRRAGICGRAPKVAARAMERRHDEGGERRYQRCSSGAGGMTGIQWPPSRNQGTADDVMDALAAPAPAEPAQRKRRHRNQRAGNNGGGARERGEGGERTRSEGGIGARETKVSARAMKGGRGEGDERRKGAGAIGARGKKVATRAMGRGRGEGGERRSGVGGIGGRATKVAARAMERGHDEGGERRYQRCSSSAGGMTGIQWPPSPNQGTADDVMDAAAPAPAEPAQWRCAR